MLTILHVEDEESDAFLFERALTKANADAEVHRVSDAIEAVNYLLGKGVYADRSKFPLPNLILLDLKMPLMSGEDFLKWRIQTRFAAVPVIVLTGSPRRYDVEHPLELGAMMALTKPQGYDGFVEVAKEISKLELH